MTEEKKYLKSFKVHRANKNKNGAASQWSLRDNVENDKVHLFLDMAKQNPTENANGDATFDWTNKMTMKMEEPDIGQILCVLRGITKEVKLFHENPKGNATLNFSMYEKDGVPVSYALKMGIQRDGKNNFAQHLVGFSDGEVLRVLLESAIKRKYKW